MTKYTTLETSNKLYEAFGWESDVILQHKGLQRIYGYDTDYLLDKLPKKIWSIYDLIIAPGENIVTGGYFDPDGIVGIQVDELRRCETPAEALALLALELKEEGVL